MAYLDLKARSQSNQLLFAQFNLKLERGLKQTCDICRTTYTVFKKQHICKRCYRSVCADCAPFKTKTYLSNRHVRLHRNCTVCNAESLKIQQYIEENKLSFCKDSDLLFIWSKALTDRKGIKVNRTKSNLKSYVQLDNLWSSFNFSFRDFIGRLIQRGNVSDADLINMISNGLDEIECFHRNKLEEGLYIYLFFLCHADIEIAVNLTLFMLDLLEKSNTTKASLKKIMKNIGFSEVEAYKLEQFLMDNEAEMKDSASINVLPITASIDIINNAIISKNINFMWKGFLLLLFERKEVVFKNLNRINLITLDLLRNPNIVNLKLHLKSESEAANGEEYQLKYAKLMNQYKALLAKNQKLEKQLIQSGDKGIIRNKILTDSMMSSQSSSSKLNDELANPNLKFKPEEFNQILESKNEEIIKLKMRSQQLESTLKEKSGEAERHSIQNARLKQQMAEKDQKISKIQEEKNNLKSINLLLIEKMKELSKMLMDQEEKEISNNNEAIQKIRQSYEEIELPKKEECSIY